MPILCDDCIFVERHQLSTYVPFPRPHVIRDISYHCKKQTKAIRKAPERCKFKITEHDVRGLDPYVH